jgi:hypothetical protein
MCTTCWGKWSRKSRTCPVCRGQEPESWWKMSNQFITFFYQVLEVYYNITYGQGFDIDEENEVLVEFVREYG